ncbi:MAG: dTMP kinase [Thermomicrobiales bacterium]|nr:dTMP kinase [Thermomicrobiales bacterium]
MRKGAFIVFEGPEGAGKSTRAHVLAGALRARGYEVVLTREPGGTPLGERVRALLLKPDGRAILPQTEALLFAAARAEHVGTVIRPALERGAVVLCDRFVDSSLAYQAGGLGLPIDEVRAIQHLAVDEIEPDLRILLDLPVERGLARRWEAGEGLNRVDLADVAFHERVRRAYHALARERPDAWAIVNADRSTAAVDRDVANAALPLVERLAPHPAAAVHERTE